jgi:hypothetical protein
MSSLVTVEVDGADGSHLVEVDLNLDSLTLRESVHLEEALGSDATEALLAGKAAQTPKLIRAIIYAKLSSQIPDLTLDGFDLDFLQLQAFIDEAAAVGADPPNG